jgi:glycosyltransferase involved in cell wall biosynthesis
MSATEEEFRAAGRLFPPERGPVFVVGNAASVFTRHLASLWRSIGIDARLVTRRWDGDRVVAGDVPVLVATDTESTARRRIGHWVERAVSPFEARLAVLQKERYARAMGSETSYRPFVSPWLADAVSISALVRAMRPQFICGQEVFAYGLATAFSWNTPRILMPWGGDIYMYSGTTTLAFAAVRHALRHVDLVVPGSPLALDYLHERFGVSRKRMHVGGLWALDRQRFRRAGPEERLRICARFGIDPGALVVMNIRRFFPAWGSDSVLRAFVRFAAEHSRSHFVLLGGAGTEPFMTRARRTLADKGLADRFTLFDGDIPLEDCALLMSIADVSVSLMREWDMRPLASILEAAASGNALILGDQPEYRAMTPLGFASILCPPGDDEAVVGALRRYGVNGELRAQSAMRNQAYLDEHEDGRKQAIALLRRVRAVCDAYGE